MTAETGASTRTNGEAGAHGGEGSHAVTATTGTADDRAHDRAHDRSHGTAGDIRHDRIRWGAVWTGALTTLSIYLVLQLLFFALGWLDLAGGGSGTTRAIVSGVLALVAFLLGGMAAGASALWRRANDGMVNGVVSWAITVVSLLALALVGGGALAGSLADTATQFIDLRNAGEGVDVAEATRTARDAAGVTALGLGLSVVAAAPGGSLGAKLWPGRGRRDAQNR